VNDELEIRSASNADGTASLIVAGEIDLSSAPRFRQALELAASRHSALEIDLRQVTYFDSAGVDAVFAYATKHRTKLIIGDNRIVATVVRVSGLAQVVTLHNGH